jgi:dTDP-4-amino-4,6-dideoxy-D-galactose acyltransferase
MNLEYLSWDSDFYLKTIFKATIENEVSEADIHRLKELNADLVYVFISKSLANSNILSKDLRGAKLYDRKVTYVKELSFAEDDQEILEFEIKEIYSSEPDLETLAYQSGEFSRFFLDDRLSHRFKDLYGRWLSKSLSRELADAVLVAKNEDNERMGFVTLIRKNSVGNIGLIAVDHEFRGKRIGSTLLKSAEKWFLQNGITRCNIVTQMDNKPACSFYEKFGYTQDKIEYIYHYWKT